MPEYQDLIICAVCKQVYTSGPAWAKIFDMRTGEFRYACPEHRDDPYFITRTDNNDPMLLTDQEMRILQLLDDVVAEYFKIPVIDAADRDEFVRYIKHLKRSIWSRPNEAALMFKKTGYRYPH